MPLCDAHCHLQDPRLRPHLAAALTAARGRGVTQFVVNGTSPADWDAVATLARDERGVIPCYGIHPWFVDAAQGAWEEALAGYLADGAACVGEIGLDRWIEPRDEALQEQVFRQQLELARRYQRPMMLHCLRAWGRLHEILKEHGPFPAGFLIHAYGGSAEMVADFAALGGYFSFSAYIAHPKRTRAREALCAVPRDRLLIETDAPDMLAPDGHYIECAHTASGEALNLPINLLASLSVVAEALAIDTNTLADTLAMNAARFLPRYT